MLVHDVRSVLDEYADFLPLTIRQTLYRLVATRCFEMSEAAYSRLCEVVNRARRAGLLTFEAIWDDGPNRYEARVRPTSADFLGEMREQATWFRLDRQEGQPARLWLLCEAGGMAPMLSRAALPFGVPVLTSSGFDSLTAKHDLAREFAASLKLGGPVEVLHIGDLDPSGEHFFIALAGDVTAMVTALCEAAPLFTRLAVTRDQAVTMDLPTAPPKATDRRAFTGDTVQAEAVAPDVLSDILRKAIADRRDSENEMALPETEAAMRDQLCDVLAQAEEWANG